MIVYQGLNPVKRLKKKYAQIVNIIDYLEDEHSKRLTHSEYQSLEMALFANKYVSQISRLNLNTPEMIAAISDASPLCAHEVTTRDNNIYYSLLFSNRKAVRINRKIYRKCPVKDHATSRDEHVAKPPSEQMSLFENQHLS